MNAIFEIVDLLGFFLIAFMILCVMRYLIEGVSMENTIKDLIDAMIYSSMPNHCPPNPTQDAILLKIRDKSGIAIVQDKGTAFIVLGPKMSITEGVFVSQERNPRFKCDVIVLNTGANSVHWYSVLFHELAHATGTTNRLSRIGISGNILDAVIYSYEEIVAESVARRVMERLGLATPETREASAKYINHYSMRIETLINQDRLTKDIDAAETLLMTWLEGIDFKAV